MRCRARGTIWAARCEHYYCERDAASGESGARPVEERQHFRDRKLLMNYEKQRAEMRKNMGLNPVLG